MSKTIPELLEKIAKLEDVVESLWSMLDEMKKSDVKNHVKALEKAHLEAIADKMLKDSGRADA